MHGAAPPPSLNPGLQALLGQAPLVASQAPAQPGGHTKHASAKRGAHMPAALQSARAERHPLRWHMQFFHVAAIATQSPHVPSRGQRYGTS